MLARILYFAVTAIAFPMLQCADALAQEYPNRAIRVLTPIAPGGLADTVTRLMSTHLAQRLGQPVIVENKPGGGGILAMESVARSAPDGYTLMFTYLGPSVVIPILQPKLPYDNANDFVPVAQIASINPFVLIVSPDLAVNDLGQFLAYAKANPGKVFYGSAGNASLSHLTMELFTHGAGLKLEHVPFEGEAPVLLEIASGRLQAAFQSVDSAAPFIKAGRVKAIVVANKQRSTQIPEVPTMAEAGFKEFDAAGFMGFLAPVGTPAGIVKRLNEEFRAIVKMPSVRVEFSRFGIEPVDGSPEAFRTVLRNETVKWSKLIKDSGIKGD